MSWCFVVSVSSRAAVAFCCCQLPDSYVISLFGLDVWFTWPSQRQTGVETSFFAFSYLEFHGPYMFPTLKAHQMLDLCPFFWCRARTSYVFKSISLTKGQQWTRYSRAPQNCYKYASARQDSPQHLQRIFLCCYALGPTSSGSSKIKNLL